MNRYFMAKKLWKKMVKINKNEIIMANFLKNNNYGKIHHA